MMRFLFLILLSSLFYSVAGSSGTEGSAEEAKVVTMVDTDGILRLKVKVGGKTRDDVAQKLYIGDQPIASENISYQGSCGNKRYICFKVGNYIKNNETKILTLYKDEVSEENINFTYKDKSFEMKVIDPASSTEIDSNKKIFEINLEDRSKSTKIKFLSESGSDLEGGKAIEINEKCGVYKYKVEVTGRIIKPVTVKIAGSSNVLHIWTSDSTTPAPSCPADDSGLEAYKGDVLKLPADNGAEVTFEPGTEKTVRDIYIYAVDNQMFSPNGEFKVEHRLETEDKAVSANSYLKVITFEIQDNDFPDIDLVFTPPDGDDASISPEQLSQLCSNLVFIKNKAAILSPNITIACEADNFLTGNIISIKPEDVTYRSGDVISLQSNDFEGNVWEDIDSSFEDLNTAISKIHNGQIKLDDNKYTINVNLAYRGNRVITGNISNLQDPELWTVCIGRAMDSGACLDEGYLEAAEGGEARFYVSTLLVKDGLLKFKNNRNGLSYSYNITVRTNAGKKYLDVSGVSKEQLGGVSLLPASGESSELSTVTIESENNQFDLSTKSTLFFPDSDQIELKFSLHPFVPLGVGSIPEMKREPLGANYIQYFRIFRNGLRYDCEMEGNYAVCEIPFDTVSGDRLYEYKYGLEYKLESSYSTENAAQRSDEAQGGVFELTNIKGKYDFVVDNLELDSQVMKQGPSVEVKKYDIPEAAYNINEHSISLPVAIGYTAKIENNSSVSIDTVKLAFSEREKASFFDSGVLEFEVSTDINNNFYFVEGEKGLIKSYSPFSYAYLEIKSGQKLYRILYDRSRIDIADGTVVISLNEEDFSEENIAGTTFDFYGGQLLITEEGWSPPVEPFNLGEVGYLFQFPALKTGSLETSALSCRGGSGKVKIDANGRATLVEESLTNLDFQLQCEGAEFQNKNANIYFSSEELLEISGDSVDYTERTSLILNLESNKPAFYMIAAKKANDLDDHLPVNTKIFNIDYRELPDFLVRRSLVYNAKREILPFPVVLSYNDDTINTYNVGINAPSGDWNDRSISNGANNVVFDSEPMSAGSDRNSTLRLTPVREHGEADGQAITKTFTIDISTGIVTSKNWKIPVDFIEGGGFTIENVEYNWGKEEFGELQFSNKNSYKLTKPGKEASENGYSISISNVDIDAGTLKFKGVKLYSPAVNPEGGLAETWGGDKYIIGVYNFDLCQQVTPEKMECSNDGEIRHVDFMLKNSTVLKDGTLTIDAFAEDILILKTQNEMRMGTSQGGNTANIVINGLLSQLGVSKGYIELKSKDFSSTWKTADAEFRGLGSTSTKMVLDNLFPKFKGSGFAFGHIENRGFYNAIVLSVDENTNQKKNFDNIKKNLLGAESNSESTGSKVDKNIEQYKSGEYGKEKSASYSLSIGFAEEKANTIYIPDFTFERQFLYRKIKLKMHFYGTNNMSFKGWIITAKADAKAKILNEQVKKSFSLIRIGKSKKIKKVSGIGTKAYEQQNKGSEETPDLHLESTEKYILFTVNPLVIDKLLPIKEAFDDDKFTLKSLGLKIYYNDSAKFTILTSFIAGPVEVKKATVPFFHASDQFEVNATLGSGADDFVSGGKGLLDIGTLDIYLLVRLAYVAGKFDYAQVKVEFTVKNIAFPKAKFKAKAFNDPSLLNDIKSSISQAQGTASEIISDKPETLDKDDDSTNIAEMLSNPTPFLKKGVFTMKATVYSDSDSENSWSIEVSIDMAQYGGLLSYGGALGIGDDLELRNNKKIKQRIFDDLTTVNIAYPSSLEGFGMYAAIYGEAGIPKVKILGATIMALITLDGLAARTIEKAQVDSIYLFSGGAEVLLDIPLFSTPFYERYPGAILARGTLNDQSRSAIYLFGKVIDF